MKALPVRICEPSNNLALLSHFGAVDDKRSNGSGNAHNRQYRH
jgi:hypothetical protein